MRIAVVQFNPKHRDIQANIESCNELLNEIQPFSLDIVVFPEMCLSGYTFNSKDDIMEFVDGAEISLKFAANLAHRLSACVQLGFPRQEDGKLYNSVALFDRNGIMKSIYDKHFLYEQDEYWATEGAHFVSQYMECINKNVGFGICMDLNPKKFLAPFNLFEFGNFHQSKDTELLLLSMAWLYSEQTIDPNKLPKYVSNVSEMELINYWATRLSPIILNSAGKRIVVVIANRIGIEEGVRFAGTSNVMLIHGGIIELMGNLNAIETKVLQVTIEDF